MSELTNFLQWIQQTIDQYQNEWNKWALAGVLKKIMEDDTTTVTSDDNESDDADGTSVLACSQSLVMVITDVAQVNSPQAEQIISNDNTSPQPSNFSVPNEQNGIKRKRQEKGTF